MSTGFSPLEECSVLRQQKDGTRVSVPCPAAIFSYNKHMGGVDRGDQLRGYYMYKLKIRKFYKYISNFLIFVSVTNAFILFREKHPGRKTTIKKFQEVLATQLIGDYCSRKKAGRVSHLIKPLPLQHFPTKVSPAGSGSERKRGRCALCQERHCRSDTSWHCYECGVWLCHSGTESNCFLLWHKKRVE